jgi:hypothetical protein
LKSAELFDVAQILANGSADQSLRPHLREGLARASVHSAYYAAYNLALNWAKYRGYRKMPGVGSHECLWDGWYGSDPATIDIQTVGKSLRDRRLDADYRINEKFRHVPQDQLDEADDLAKLIDADRERVIVRQEEDRTRAFAASLPGMPALPPPKPPRRK